MRLITIILFFFGKKNITIKYFVLLIKNNIYEMYLNRNWIWVEFVLVLGWVSFEFYQFWFLSITIFDSNVVKKIKSDI